MRFIVTTNRKNRKNEEWGLRVENKTPSIESYLLGYINKNENRRYITYLPQRVSYIIETSPEKYLKKYLMLGNKQYDKDYLNRRRDFIKTIYNNSYALNKFFQNYSKFIEKNPDFEENQKKYYKGPIFIPKKKMKLVKGIWKQTYRETYGPTEQLLALQQQAVTIFTDVFGYKTNDMTYAYTKGRDAIMNGMMHRYSKHIVKLDLENFFTTIDKEFLITQLHSLKEFAILQLAEFNNFKETSNKVEFSRYYLQTKKFIDIVIKLAYMDNELPQGSALSPILSNIAMAQFDIAFKKLADSKTISKTKMMYTRYSDDLTFSSLHPIDLEKLLKEIKLILKNSPLKIKENKTKYLKNTQRCFVTGVKINKDNKGSYGHEKREMLKRDIFTAMMNIKNGTLDIEENQKLIGNINYAMQINKENIQSIVNHYAYKFGVLPKNFYKYLVTGKKGN